MHRNTLAQSAQAKHAFLKCFAQWANISYACEMAGVARRNVYDWQERDEDFSRAFKIAESAATERLEREAWRRAVDGSPYKRTSYWHGEPVGTDEKIEYSDQLLQLLLRARQTGCVPREGRRCGLSDRQVRRRYRSSFCALRYARETLSVPTFVCNTVGRSPTPLSTPSLALRPSLCATRPSTGVALPRAPIRSRARNPIARTPENLDGVKRKSGCERAAVPEIRTSAKRKSGSGGGASFADVRTRCSPAGLRTAVLRLWFRRSMLRHQAADSSPL